MPQTLCGDEELDLERFSQIFLRPVLNYLVGLGHAGPSVFVFKIGLHHGGLNYPTGTRRRLEHIPGEGAVASPLESNFLHQREKRFAITWVDLIFDINEYRPLPGVYPLGESRLVPVQRWR